MIKRFALCLAMLALLNLPALPASAGELPAPTGPVVLTVAGKIGKTNRPAFDDFEDGFFKYHEKQFDSAAAFDLAMLEGLGMQAITLEAPVFPRAFRIEGPRLADLLAAVDARGESIMAVALDGYGIEIGRAELEAQNWIVGLKRDGAYLGLGQRGPTWIVYTRKDGKPATEEDELRWPWAAFYIEVR